MAIFSILVLTIILTGCSLLYGEMIHEEEENYSEKVTYTFTLDEADLTINVNLEIGYSKTSSKSARAYYTATLTAPDGATQTESIRASKTGTKKVLVGFIENNLFEIISQQGEYTLLIEETENSNFDGNSLTLKVYQK